MFIYIYICLFRSVNKFIFQFGKGCKFLYFIFRLRNVQIPVAWAAKFCVVRPNIFSIITAVRTPPPFLSPVLRTEMCTSLHEPSIKCQSTLRDTGHLKIVRSQYGTCCMLPFGRQAFWGEFVGPSVYLAVFNVAIRIMRLFAGCLQQVSAWQFNTLSFRISLFLSSTISVRINKNAIDAFRDIVHVLPRPSLLSKWLAFFTVHV